MFRVLLVHPQEAIHKQNLGYVACVLCQLVAQGLEWNLPQEGLHKQQLVYCVRIMSFGCTRVGVQLSCSSSGGTAQGHVVYCVRVMSFGCTRVGVQLSCSSSGGTAQAAPGILHACYVGWLHQV
jgi:hypothetical protein